MKTINTIFENNISDLKNTESDEILEIDIDDTNISSDEKYTYLLKKYSNLLLKLEIYSKKAEQLYKERDYIINNFHKLYEILNKEDGQQNKTVLNVDDDSD